VFSLIRGSGYSKSRLAKAAGAEVALKQRNEKWHAAVAGRAFKSKCTKQARVGAIFQVPICKNGTPLWRKSKGTKHHMLGAIFQVQKWHAAVARITFASQNAQKWHAAVARSTCASQNVQNICVWNTF